MAHAAIELDRLKESEKARGGGDTNNLSADSRPSPYSFSSHLTDRFG